MKSKRHIAIVINIGLAALLTPATSNADNQLSKDAQLALHAQMDHYAAVARRGEQVFYTKKFDLSGLPHYQPEQVLAGWIKIHGNNYINDGNLGEYWKQGFKKFQPGLHLSFFLPTSAATFSALYDNQADIGMGLGPKFYDLLAYERIMNYDPLAITVVTGSYDVSGWTNSFAVIVNAANPLTKITVDQLDGVFGAARDGGWAGTNWHTDWARGPEKNIRTWGQLGLTGEWADKRITPYGFSLRYNTSDFFADKVLQGSDKWNEDLHAYANYVKPDGTRSIEADQINDSMVKDRYGIAYLLFRGDRPGTKRLAVAPRGTTNYVDHTLENVQNRTYPLFNEMFFYMNVRPGTPLDPKLKEFCRYVLSQEGQAEVQRDGKYLPLTAEVVREQLKKLE
ncbi:MAG: substrate-binding domain-containing protein [Opitutaceae bacterium]|nr:substrate-binding domain-containing protein [Opitutaceae bacterium]